jgi:hypothetical protein
MEKGTHPYGMQTFAMALQDLLERGIVDEEVTADVIG